MSDAVFGKALESRVLVINIGIDKHEEWIGSYGGKGSEVGSNGYGNVYVNAKELMEGTFQICVEDELIEARVDNILRLSSNMRDNGFINALMESHHWAPENWVCNKENIPTRTMDHSEIERMLHNPVRISGSAADCRFLTRYGAHPEPIFLSSLAHSVASSLRSLAINMGLDIFARDLPNNTLDDHLTHQEQIMEKRHVFLKGEHEKIGDSSEWPRNFGRTGSNEMLSPNNPDSCLVKAARRGSDAPTVGEISGFGTPGSLNYGMEKKENHIASPSTAGEAGGLASQSGCGDVSLGPTSPQSSHITSVPGCWRQQEEQGKGWQDSSGPPGSSIQPIPWNGGFEQDWKWIDRHNRATAAVRSQNNAYFDVNRIIGMQRNPQAQFWCPENTDYGPPGHSSNFPSFEAEAGDMLADAPPPPTPGLRVADLGRQRFSLDEDF